MSADAEIAVLAALSKTSAQNPVTIDDVKTKLPWLDHGRIESALAELAKCRVVNYATIIRDNVARTFYWATGLGLEDTAQGRMLLAKSRMETGNAMRDKDQDKHDNDEKNMNVSDMHITDQVLHALDGTTKESPMSLDAILARCPSAKSRDALAHVLRRMCNRGEISVRNELHGGRYCNLYWLPNGEERQDVDVRFALWDDGSLSISVGSSQVRIAQEHVARLANLLSRWYHGD